ncbi:MAG: HPr family phosphocarrier protein [Lachnospiraceae bacterium]|nr:HPr family phosphocarrier protein [Lachnospiraceae bacterium]
MIKTIRLTPDGVRNFVNVASKCDFDIDVSYNRYVVDGKSFLGVYALDFTRPLKVSYDVFNAEFEELLKQLTVAC